MDSLKVYIGRGIPAATFLKISELDSKYDTINSQSKGMGWLLKTFVGNAVVFDEQTNKVAAYASVISLNDKAYNLALEGKLDPKEISKNDVLPFRKRRTHHLYFYNVVIDKDYQGTMLTAKLIYGIFENFALLASKGIFAFDIIADGYSETINSLIKVLGIKYIKTSDHDSLIYQAKFYPFTFKIPNAIKDEIVPLYDKKFGNHRKVR